MHQRLLVVIFLLVFLKLNDPSSKVGMRESQLQDPLLLFICYQKSLKQSYKMGTILQYSKIFLRNE